MWIVLLGQGATEEAAAAEVLGGEEDPQALSEAEVAERDLLLESGFSNWNRRDFNAFVRAAEKYGRAALKEIASEIDGKTEEDVWTDQCCHTTWIPTGRNK